MPQIVPHCLSTDLTNHSTPISVVYIIKHPHPLPFPSHRLARLQPFACSMPFIRFLFLMKFFILNGTFKCLRRSVCVRVCVCVLTCSIDLCLFLCFPGIWLTQLLPFSFRLVVLGKIFRSQFCLLLFFFPKGTHVGEAGEDKGRCQREWEGDKITFLMITKRLLTTFCISRVKTPECLHAG